MRYVIIGQKDSNELLVVDTHTMTVSSVDANATSLNNAEELRAEGTLKGVDFAVAANDREVASGRWLYA
jgi:hypothetical protein